MRIVNPQREAETVWAFGNPFNRTDIEAAVFQSDSMAYISGEYEASVFDGDIPGEALLRVNLECFDPDRCDRTLVEDRFVSRFLKYKSLIAEHYHDGSFAIEFNFTGPRGLEFYSMKGRPRRLIDRRVH
jgi:phenylacetate-coenzyme A ligase PaaK-like adenylate-forming protein